MSVQFFNNLSAAEQSAGEKIGHTHSHETDAPHSHDHGDEYGHTHEHLEHPGKLEDCLTDIGCIIFSAREVLRARVV